MCTQTSLLCLKWDNGVIVAYSASLQVYVDPEDEVSMLWKGSEKLQ